MNSRANRRWKKANRSRSTVRATAFCCASAAGILTGCTTATTKMQAAAPTQTDRLIRYYPELEQGRFVVIADFEDPAHQEIFDLVKTSPRASMEFDETGGRRETGTRCLKVQFGSRDDTLRIHNDRATTWHLKRDWRGYDLLLLSAYVPSPARRAGSAGPAQATSLDVTVFAGPPQALRSATTTARLQPGWNRIALDLADAGDRLSLDDIRGIEITPGPGGLPAFCLDDLLLTADCEAVFGDSGNRDGRLYVQRVGRRFRVGAGGQFELVFGNGQIVGWYDLVNDPSRFKNRVAGALFAPFGPNLDPDVQKSSSTPLRKSERLHARMRIQPTIARITMDCEFFEGESGTNGIGQKELESHYYVIYPTGQVFVSRHRFAESGQHDAQSYETVLGLARNPGCEARVSKVLIKSPSDSAAAGTNSQPFGMFRVANEGAVLLFVPWSVGEPARVETKPAGDDPFIFRTHWPTAPRTSCPMTAQLFLGGGLESDAELQDRATAYLGAPTPILELGERAVSRSSCESSNGFDPIEGSYRVRAVKGCARFTIDGRMQALYSPAIEVEGIEGRETWVYINDELFGRSVPLYDGNSILFQIPGVRRDLVRVEVLARGLSPRAIGFDSDRQ